MIEEINENAEITSGILSLADVDVTPEEIATWTPEQQTTATSWASLVHLRASDNDVEVPPKPEFLNKYPACASLEPADILRWPKE